MKKFIKLIMRIIFTAIVKSYAQNVGEDLGVHGFSKVTDKTVLGNNVNFNGMRIAGAGKVYIGNNFHSGGVLNVNPES